MTISLIIMIVAVILCIYIYKYIYIYIYTHTYIILRLAAGQLAKAVPFERQGPVCGKGKLYGIVVIVSY